MTTWDRWADIYDDFWSGLNPAQAVAFLESLAPGGRFLEYGAGTGRVSLPLAIGGNEVIAVEASSKMAARMAAEECPATLTVVVGDMREYLPEVPVNVVLCVFNSIFEMKTQEDQLRVFHNAHEGLLGGGFFVVESSVPSAGGVLGSRQQVAVRDVGPGTVGLSISMNDPLTQRLSFREVRLSNEGVHVLEVENRFAWPGELDLMARLAGLRLAKRFANWNSEPATADSRSVISLYRREER